MLYEIVTFITELRNKKYVHFSLAFNLQYIKNPWIELPLKSYLASLNFKSIKES